MKFNLTGAWEVDTFMCNQYNLHHLVWFRIYDRSNILFCFGVLKQNEHSDMFCYCFSSVSSSVHLLCFSSLSVLNNSSNLKCNPGPIMLSKSSVFFWCLVMADHNVNWNQIIAKLLMIVNYPLLVLIIECMFSVFAICCLLAMR